MRKQVMVVMLLLLGFAGVGSSAVVTRALQPHSLSAVQQERRIGPKPLPRWYWRWVEWRLGEGYAKGHQLEPGLRPHKAPRSIPDWAWERLHFFQLARTERALAAASKSKGHHPTTSTTTTTTTPTTTTTGTTTTTTPTTTTTGTTTTTTSSTYADAIAYTQTRPSFTPSRTVGVSSASQLQSAISNLQPGDLVKATASFTVTGQTKIANRLSAPAELDLSGVSFVYSGGQNMNAVWVDNAQNLYIYGGDLSTSDSGGTCLGVYGSQHVLWWGFTAHDCGANGFQAQAIGGPVDHNDFQGTIWKVGQNLAWDPHTERGTGLHGANLWDATQTNAFTNNRFAFYAHDIPVGACVEFGNNQPASQATGNVLYLKCVKATNRARKATGGNALQIWGDTSRLGLDVKFLEGKNLQGFGLRANGIYQGQTAKSVIIEYGRARNTNQNPRYAGQSPWDSNGDIVYKQVRPTP